MAVWCVAASFMSSISFVLLHLCRFISLVSSELLFSVRKWCGGNHWEPLFKIVWLAYHGGYLWMCCFLSLLVGSLGLRGLALFQTLRCGYSTAPSVVLQAWEWSFGWVSLPLWRLKCIISSEEVAGVGR